MAMPQQTSLSWGSFFLALAGVAWCAVLASPLQESLPCPTSGCYLFRDVTIAGISLWWFGLGAFAFLALLCLGHYRILPYAFALLCLILDCVLLVIMFFTAPCLTCLVAALLFALVFLCLRRPLANRYQAPGPAFRLSPVFLVWAALFIANLGSAASEQMGGWVLDGPADSPIRVYFSPSCPYCRDAIREFAGRAAFLPVAEGEADYQAIHAMQDALAAGMNITEALNIAQNPSVQPPLIDSAVLRLRLLRNSGAMRGHGFTMLPLIMINGMPQTDAASATPSPATPALPSELNIYNLGQCGDDYAPCDARAPGL